MLRHVELALLQTGAVESCAVVARDGDDGPVRVAYVVADAHVPFSATAVDERLRDVVTATDLPTHYVELRRLPLDEAGNVDRAALLALPVVDESLAQRVEQALQAAPGIRAAAVLVEEDPIVRPPVHLSAILPGWDGMDDATQSPASTGAHEEAAAARPPAHADGGPLVIPGDAPRTLTGGLLRTAAERGERCIRLIQADGREETLTYATLLDRARRVLGGLRHAGLAPGSVVILQLPDLDEHFPVFWGCLLGGIRPVTVAVPTAYDARNAVVRKLFNTWRLLDHPPVIATSRLMDGVRSLASSLEMPGLQVLEAGEMLRHDPAFDDHQNQPADIAFIQLSSGSTGVSKCIPITHGGVVHHIHASQQMLGLSPDDVTLNWLPMDHVVPLLMYHCKDVYLGIEQVQVPGPVVLGNPLSWLDYMEKYRATHTWSPNFGFKMLGDALAAARDRRWDLSHVKGLLNAGEQVTPPVVGDFLERVAPCGIAPSAMQPAFGMAEVCTCMTYELFDPAQSVQRFAKSSLHAALREPAGDEPAVSFVSCGPVAPGVQVRIADKANNVLPEGTIGRLQIKGPVVTPGYLNNPAANEEAMVGDGWFNSGDLGFLWGGRLTLTGREKELIIINGANYYCYEIEDAASGVAGVLPTFSAACGVPDPSTGTEALAFFFVHDPAATAGVVDTVRAIRTELAAQIGLSPAYVIPVTRDEFPKTTSGKIQRGQLKQWLLEGRFREVLRDLDLALENANTLPDWFYRVAWRRKTITDGTRSAGGATVVFADSCGIAAGLLASWTAGPRPIVVEPGSGFRRVAADRYEIDPAAPDDYFTLFAELANTAGGVGTVLHLRACDDEDDDSPAAVERAMRAGVYSVLLVAQGLAAQQTDRRVRLVVASRGACAVLQGDRIRPAHAAISGLVKTIPAELSAIDCRHVDLDGTVESDIAALLREVATPDVDRQVAYRRGERWVSGVEVVDLSTLPDTDAAFSRGATYLVTGALGGVGFEVSTYLLAQVGARLILVGRTAVTGWPDAAGGEAAPVPDERRQALEELQRLGEVQYVEADVADESRLRAGVEAALARWGDAALDGVLHLAGVFAERTVSDGTVEDFAAVLRPKVAGTLALHRLVAERPGALFLTFSSGYGFFGGFAAGAYAAANAFLDGFVHWQRQTSPLRARCIAWALWKETGMSRGYAHEEAARARGYRLLTRRQALQSLLAATRRDLPHVLIGLDENGRAIRSQVLLPALGARRLTAYCTAPEGVDVAAIAAALDVRDALGHRVVCTTRRVEQVPQLSTGEVDRRALAAAAAGGAIERVAPRSEIERVVASVWQDALKQDGLSVHDNFFELGGTSFLAGQIAGRLRARLDTTLASTQIFQFPTIAAQAAFLLGDTSASTAAYANSQSRGATRREAARRQRRGTPQPGAR